MTSLCSVIIRTSDFIKSVALTDRVTCVHTNTHIHHGVWTITCTHIDFNALFTRFEGLYKNLNYSFCFWTSIMPYLVIYLNSGFNTRTFHNRCMLLTDIGQVFVHVLGFHVPVTNLYMLRLICHLHLSAQQAQLVSSGLAHCLSVASLPVLSGLQEMKFPVSHCLCVYSANFRQQSYIWDVL